MVRPIPHPDLDNTTLASPPAWWRACIASVCGNLAAWLLRLAAFVISGTWPDRVGIGFDFRKDR
jgi:hypothetical protein